MANKNHAPHATRTYTHSGYPGQRFPMAACSSQGSTLRGRVDPAYPVTCAKCLAALAGKAAATVAP